MRTGKIGLNGYLHEIGKTESANCNRCSHLQPPRKQDVAHVLVQCPALTELRMEMWKRIGRRTNDTNQLLVDPALAKHAAIFMLQSKLLGQFRQVDFEKEVALVYDPMEVSLGGDKRYNTQNRASNGDSTTQ